MVIFIIQTLIWLPTNGSAQELVSRFSMASSHPHDHGQRLCETTLELLPHSF